MPGFRDVRIEDEVLISNERPKILTYAPTDLIQIAKVTKAEKKETVSQPAS